MSLECIKISQICSTSLEMEGTKEISVNIIFTEANQEHTLLIILETWRGVTSKQVWAGVWVAVMVW